MIACSVYSPKLLTYELAEELSIIISCVCVCVCILYGMNQFLSCPKKDCKRITCAIWSFS